MSEIISDRELRDAPAVILRRVEAGESFTVTTNGRPVADLVPHRECKRRTIGEAQEAFRKLLPIDVEEWYRDRAEADRFFGP